MTTITTNLPVENGRIQSTGILSYLFVRSETHNHQGIDIVAPVGTPVRSVTDGIVVDSSNTLAEHFSGYGRIVQIQFVDPPLKPVYILYAHLDKAMVNVGEQIKKGQQIGTVGKTCFSLQNPSKICNGSHLHFEIRQKQYLPAEGNRLDPIVFLSQYGEISPIDLMKIKNEESQNRKIVDIGTIFSIVTIGGIVWYFLMK